MPQNSKYEIQKRRAEVSELYLSGIPQFRIAGKVGCSPSQVSRDLKALMKQWQQQSVMDIGQAKSRELAKIDLAEQRAWEGWETSRFP